MSNSTDVAIVGGGIIGCSIAYFLAKRGIRSAVFERDSFACGASGATAGMFSPLWHVDHTNEALFEMGMRSLEMIPRLAAELAEVYDVVLLDSARLAQGDLLAAELHGDVDEDVVQARPVGLLVCHLLLRSPAGR